MLTLIKIKNGNVIGWILARDLSDLLGQITRSLDPEANAVLLEINSDLPQGRTILSNGLVLLKAYG